MPKILKMIARWIALMTVCGGAVAQEGAPSTLRLAGSELIGQRVLTVFQEKAADANVRLSLKFTGSRHAFDAVNAGIVDVAVVLDETAGRTLPEGWVSLPLAHILAVVAAPADLTLNQMNYPDLAEVFGRDSAAANSRWGDFGADGSWAYVPISTHVTTAADGLAYEIFRHRVLRETEFKGSVKAHDSVADTLASMRSDDGGIAVVPWLPEGESKFKALLVASSAEEVAFGPTAENLAAGDYPLALPLRLAFEKARAKELRPWLKLWYGDEISTALQASQLMPLPRPARNQQVFELEVIDDDG